VYKRQGSAHPPRLVVVRYTPERGPRSRHVVVAGKGITYDTGGLAIKPRESMVAMKTDMTGAAVALATVLGAAALRVPHRVTALLPLAENAFGGASYRPGDVVTVHGGTTVEIANPDAEGRMVLADALAYAAAELDPDVLVDVATLTGAATLGLGQQHGALFTPDDELAAALTAAGDAAGERLWRMPPWWPSTAARSSRRSPTSGTSPNPGPAPGRSPRRSSSSGSSATGVGRTSTSPAPPAPPGRRTRSRRARRASARAPCSVG